MKLFPNLNRHHNLNPVRQRLRLRAGLRLGQTKTGRILSNATGGENANHGLVISVARGEHGGETGDFLLATADGARLFELPAHTHVL